MLSLLLLLACAPKAPPPPAVAPPQIEQTYARLREEAAEDERNRALIELRRASLALNHGDADEAEHALRGAVTVMQDFTAKGEVRAMVGSEDRKQWKGEPHEKVAAFTLLGVLLQAEGDRGNALAMYRSAVLADSGTVLDRYRSDVVSAWVLQALAFQAEGEPDNADAAMTRAVDALWARTWQPVLTETLSTCDEAVPRCAARSALYTALSPALAAQPRDPQAAADAAVSIAGDLLLQAQQLDRKDRPGTLSGFGKGKLRRAGGEILADEAAGWKKRLVGVRANPVAVEAPGDALALPAGVVLSRPLVTGGESLADDPDPARVQPRLERLLAEPPDVILLLPHGRGPQKIALGRYEQALAYTNPRAGLRAPAVRVDGRVPDGLLPLDSMTWQAQSRGGRRVDALLRGKAVYKQTAADVGEALLEAAWITAILDDRNSPLAPALAIVGCVSLTSAAIITPRADTRGWEQIPDSFLLLAGRFGPGAHSLDIDGRRYTLQVPEDGQLVAVLPWTPPWGLGSGGTGEIAPRDK